MGSVLLVCTGNICRSPMAEGILRDRLARRRVDLDVRSSGVAGWEGSAATPEAVRAAAELGVDISGHVATRFFPNQAFDAELVIAMTEEHAAAMAQTAPGAASRTFTLKEMVNILDHSNESIGPFHGSGLDRLHQAVAEADRRRGAGEVTPIADTDIADPLGLGVEAYRATAWELEQLMDRLVDAIFPEGWDAEQPGPATTIAGGSSRTTGSAGSTGSDEPFVASWDALEATDPDVAKALASELERERSMLRLIASE